MAETGWASYLNPSWQRIVAARLSRNCSKYNALFIIINQDYEDAVLTFQERGEDMTPLERHEIETEIGILCSMRRALDKLKDLPSFSQDQMKEAGVFEKELRQC